MSDINTDYSWLNSLSSVPNTDKTGGTSFDAVFENDKETGVSVDDFFNLMLQQLTNQDFMNPTDDTQYLAQLAQFATMEQMIELGEFSKQNYVTSLLGKTVTVSSYNIGGSQEDITGKVDRVTMDDGDYKIYIGDKSFSLDSIREIFSPEEKKDETDNPEEPGIADYFAL